MGKVSMRKRVMAVSMTAVMAASMLAGCGGSSTASNVSVKQESSPAASADVTESSASAGSTASSSDASASGSTTDGGYVVEKDANGNPIDLGGMEIIVRDWWSPEEEAEPANEYEEARQEYHEWLEKTYNFKLKSQAISDWGSAPQDFVDYVTAGDDGNNYVFTLRNDPALTAAMKSGLCFDLATLDCLDFSTPQFQKNRTHEMYTYGDHVYGCASGDPEPRGGMFFNKRLLEEAGIDPESIYDMQKEGTWTWDAWKGIMDKVQRDVDNDGVIDIYGTTQNNGNLVNECVWSNGGSYIGKDADGKFVYRLEDPETVEGLQFALDCLNNYSATYGEDAQWDAYKEGYLNGKAVFLPDDAYNGTPGNMLQDMKDDFGFVCFPKGPKAKDYVNCWSNNPIVIPGCYDKDKAWKLAFAWRVWNSDVPGYENYEGWKSNYYSGMRDTRSVDETLEILRTHGMIDYSGVVPNVSVGSDFVWSVAPGADLTSVIEGIRDTWKTYIDDANKG